MTEKEKLLARLNKHKWEMFNGCWRWVGSTSGLRARVNFKGKNLHVTRLIMWIVYDFDINSKLYVLHKTKDGTCKYEDCWNPEHLYLGNQSENMHDRITTHCRNGHEYTPANTFYHQGCIKCRECSRERAREYSKKKKSQKHNSTV